MPFPKNPNKVQKPKKVGLKLATQIAASIERKLKKVPAEHRDVAHALVRATIHEIENPVVAEVAEAVAGEF